MSLPTPQVPLEEIVERIGDRLSEQDGLNSLTRDFRVQLLGRQLDVGENAIGNSFLKEIHFDLSAIDARSLDYATAHELIHFVMTQWVRGEHDERVVHRGARALLMPRGRFYEAIEKVGLDVPGLARLFPRAPPEAVGLRLADLVRGTVASAWSGGRLLERASATDLSATDAEAASRWAERQLRGVAIGGRTPRGLSSMNGRAVGWRLGTRTPGLAVVVCQVLFDPILIACERGELVYDPGERPLGNALRLLPVVT